MPITETQYPVLSHFLCSVEKNTGMPPLPLGSTSQTSTDNDSTPKQLPKGVVLGPDGKPYVCSDPRFAIQRG